MKAKDREFTILALGVALLGAVGWHFLIEPMRHALLAERLMLQDTKQEIAAGKSGDTQSDSDRVIKEIDTHAQHFTELWSQAEDDSGLYERIEDHAAEAGVRIEHIDPRRVSVAGDLSRELAEIGIDVSRRRYSIELSGDFNAVRLFVSLCQGDEALTRVDSFRMSAASNASDSETVAGNVSVAYFAIAGAFAEAAEVEP